MKLSDEEIDSIAQDVDMGMDVYLQKKPEKQYQFRINFYSTLVIRNRGKMTSGKLKIIGMITSLSGICRQEKANKLWKTL